ncbi:MAG TPA: hypothetical protein VF766_07595 [Pyrinomonadaceae bacterium]
MKNRRLTIFCVAVIALAGTPRAWQEAGKLLAFVQHKAQVKFWSMVLQPKARESMGAELVASAQPFEMNRASLDSTCALKGVEAQGNQAWSSLKQTRKVNSASSAPKAEAQRTMELPPLSHAGLIAKALKASRGDSNAESLRHSRSTFEKQQLEFAESRGALLARHSVPVAPHPPASKADTYKFVVLPEISPVAAALIEKEAGIKFKLLKKPSTEPKQIRQKTRLPVGRSAAAFFPGT